MPRVLQHHISAPGHIGWFARRRFPGMAANARMSGVHGSPHLVIDFNSFMDPTWPDRSSYAERNSYLCALAGRPFQLWYGDHVGRHDFIWFSISHFLQRSSNWFTRCTPMTTISIRRYKPLSCTQGTGSPHRMHLHSPAT